MGEVIKTKAGELTVLETCRIPYGRQGRNAKMCKALCVCGKTFQAWLSHIRSGRTHSCGCYLFTINTKHGHAKKGRISPTFVTWSGIMTRCTNHNFHAYHLYGGKGIKLCNEWLDFQGFLDDVGEKPAGHRFLRIDKDGDYEPDNCEWVPINGKRRKK